MKEVIESIGNEFSGPSPPSIFVGRYGYPKVYTGVLSIPVEVENPGLFDTPEDWARRGAGIGDVLGMRGMLIYSRDVADVRNPGRFVEIQQELAMSSRPAEVEVRLRSKPRFDFGFDLKSSPIGSPGEIEELKLTENPRVPVKVERVVGDTDLDATTALSELYRGGIDVNSLSKILSAGLLGIGRRRKLVPTRWSITATDDTISKDIIERVKTYPKVNEVSVYTSDYLGNHFEVFLVPGEWSFELMEVKMPGSVWNITGRRPYITQDWERNWGRSSYAENCGGGYYAARLGAVEHLERIRRQASVFIYREVRDEYWAPLGVWVVRECVRKAMRSKPKVYPSLEYALNDLRHRIRMDVKHISSRSFLLRELRVQRRLKEFL